MNKKIVILAPYSHPSSCGIWNRVYLDAKCLLADGNDVYVFTSNIIKGTKDLSESYEEYEGVKIYRFPVFFRIGGTSMFWNFFPALSKIQPDIIHSHGFRHPHSFFSMIWAKLNGKKVLHTTHAPFEKDKNRSIFLKLVDQIYDLFVSWWELRMYDKVIRISRWEEKYIRRFGIRNSIYIPNGIKSVFSSNAPDSSVVEEKIPKYRVLYMGRIHPVKRPEWIRSAAQKLSKYRFKIFGPLDGYEEFKSGSHNLDIIQSRYNADEFIKELRESDIYVLPSVREALPFTLLEAMSQGVFVISSNTRGGDEVIEDGNNGFLVKNEDELVEKILYIYKNFFNLSHIRKSAIQTALEYSEEGSAKKLIELYNTL